MIVEPGFVSISPEDFYAKIPNTDTFIDMMHKAKAHMPPKSHFTSKFIRQIMVEEKLLLFERQLTRAEKAPRWKELSVKKLWPELS